MEGVLVVMMVEQVVAYMEAKKADPQEATRVAIEVELLGVARVGAPVVERTAAVEVAAAR